MAGFAPSAAANGGCQRKWLTISHIVIAND